MAENKSINWADIAAFELETAASEYGFSTRLAYEQGWSDAFTQEAILEYKKFMYLAAISPTMVSPSKIVDEVWHLHLLFTQSYQAFCKLLGKKIEHIPNTHHQRKNQGDKKRTEFEQAFEHTLSFYKTHFGEYPDNIWRQPEFLAGLSTIEIDTGEEYSTSWIKLLILLGILTPFVLLIESISSRRIENIDFLVYFAVGFGLVSAGLHYYRLFFQEKFVQRLLDTQTELQKMSPEELAYLSEKNSDVICHFWMNECLDNQLIRIDSEHKIFKENIPKNTPISPKQAAVLGSFPDTEEGKFYPAVLNELREQKIVRKTSNWVDKLIEKTAQNPLLVSFSRTRNAVLAGFIGLGLLRVVVGLIFGKPVLFLVILLIIFTLTAWVASLDLVKNMLSQELNDWYKREIARTATDKPELLNSWQYLLVGKTAFAASLVPLIGYVERHQGGGDASGGGSCGSSCGSSCGGGGCGGCGGGGD